MLKHRAWFLLIIIWLGSLTLTCAAAEKPVHPITTLDGKDGYLLGGVVGTNWKDADEVAEKIKGGERYSVYDFKRKVGEEIGNRPVPDEYYSAFEITFEGYGTTINEDARGGKDYASVFDQCLALAIDWNALPRVPKLLPCNTTSYNSVLIGILKRHGLRNPQIVKQQVIKVDLEGDGVEEVLLTASNFIVGEYDSEPWLPVTRQKGKYSIVILRKVINGRVENIELAVEVCHKDEPAAQGPPYASYVPFILDADGDGQLEIFVQSNYYEGWGYNIYKSIKGKAVCVLSFGIGA
jgi:hypothetical protein